MREIKFRAWDDGRYFYNVGVTPLQVLIFEDIGNSLGVPHVVGQIGIECDGLAVEQFTGLRDKNGREIYEGDIVNSSYFMRRGVFEVKWEDGGDDAYVWHGYPFDGEDVEVIGNIHENPKLIGN